MQLVHVGARLTNEAHSPQHSEYVLREFAAFQTWPSVAAPLKSVRRQIMLGVIYFGKNSHEFKRISLI
jgi:hypothetical protein